MSKFWNLVKLEKWGTFHFLSPQKLPKKFLFSHFLSFITGDSNTRDFAYSYFNQWTPNDAEGTEDVTHSIVGAICQIYGTVLKMKIIFLKKKKGKVSAFLKLL